MRGTWTISVDSLQSQPKKPFDFYVALALCQELECKKDAERTEVYAENAKVGSDQNASPVLPNTPSTPTVIDFH